MTPDEADFPALLEQEAAAARAAGADARLRAALRRQAELSALLAERDGEVEALQRHVEVLAREGASVRTLVARRAEAAEARAAGAADERDAALRELERARERLARTEARIAHLEGEVGRQQGERDAVRAELAAARDEIAALTARTAEHEALHVERDALRTARDAATQRLASVEAQLQAALRRADGLQRQADDLRIERDGAEHAARVSRAEHQAQVRELTQTIARLRLTLAATRQDVERAQASRAWRLGHGVSRTASRALLRPERTQGGALQAALRRIDELEASTRSLPTPAGAPAPPTAPVPVEPPAATPADPVPAPPPAANGRAALAREIRLRLGPPPQLEAWPPVSVVLVGEEGSPKLGRLTEALEHHTDYPELEMVRIAEGRDAGVTGAAHDLVLLLDERVEPFESGWLRELVAAHAQGRHAITGAVVLEHDDEDARPPHGRVVAHRGLHLAWRHGGPWPVGAGAGEDVFGEAFGVERAALAVSSACLLVGRTTLEAIGGLSSRYGDVLDDLDLGLRARGAGLSVAVTGRAILAGGPAQRGTSPWGPSAAVRGAGRRALLERWGPALHRAARAARLDHDGAIAAGAPHVAIVRTSSDERGGHADWAVGRELGDALAARGWRVSFATAADDPGDLPDDLDHVVTLVPAFDARRVPAGVTVTAWVCGGTDGWLEQPWFDRLDVLLAPSRTSADRIESRTGRASLVFPPATNPARFAAPRHGAPRPVDAVPTGRRRGIRGKRHAGVARAYDELPAVYAGARLAYDEGGAAVLADGAVSGRVLDALASGALPVTNCVAGAHELFGEDFPVWTEPREQRALRTELLGHPDRREALVRRHRATVLREHTYDCRADELIRVLREREALTSVCIKIGAPDAERAERWGDLHLARAIERELRRRGHRCLVQTRDRWEDDEGLAYDVALHLKGRQTHFPKPGQRNVLWCISHPAELTGEECDAHDLVAVAGEPFAAHLRELTGTPVVVLEQATDTRVFFREPHPDPAHHHDIVYVANSRGVLRTMMREALPAGLDVAVYGGDWDGLIDARHVVAEHVANDELRHIYSSAKVVLADHWDDMREWGFVSNRIHDALACGAVVVSDQVHGLDGRFRNVITAPPGGVAEAVAAALARGPELTADGAPVDEPNRVEGLVDALLAHLEGL